jgi:hypothetical protein
VPARVEQTGGAVAPALRCFRCGAAVEGTRHTRTGYTVGHYVLHTGRTEEATVRRRDDEAATTYRRLLDPVAIVSCPRCFVRPEVRRLWDAFGDEEGSAA